MGLLDQEDPKPLYTPPHPCCDKHKEVNKAYWEIEAERRYYEQLNKELYA